MLKEFAIEPEALAELADCRAILDMFVMGRGAYICAFPGKWQKNAFETAKRIARPVELLRILNKLEKIDKRLLLPSGREYNSDPKLTWRDNAWRADVQAPFDCLILKSVDNEHAITQKIVLAEEVASDHPAFAAMGQTTVLRNAIELPNSVSLLVRNAKRIKFVEPYFKNGARFEPSIKGILEKSLVRLDSQVSVELHTQIESSGRPSEALIRECFENIGAAFGMDVRVCIHPFADMHNRFLLTDRGGVMLGAGFDGKTTPNVTTMTHSDVLVVLNRTQFEEQWKLWSLTT